jgi:hypothetical protein
MNGCGVCLTLLKLPASKNNKGGIRHMKDFISKFQESLYEDSFKMTFQELACKGAQLMLRLALEAEINDFIEDHRSKIMPNGHQRIVRNGYNPERKIQTGIGDISVKVPRSRDQEGGDNNKEQILYNSQMIPKYLRGILKTLFHFIFGVSFAFKFFTVGGQPVSFSPCSLNREEWEEISNETRMSSKIHILVGRRIYFNIREKEDKICILVIIGATDDGRKELVAMDVGYRESEPTWHGILVDLKQRGLSVGPSLAIGDGSLGFWNALVKEYPSTVQQRCWVHRTRNILDKF